MITPLVGPAGFKRLNPGECNWENPLAKKVTCKVATLIYLSEDNVLAKACAKVTVKHLQLKQ